MQMSWSGFTLAHLQLSDGLKGTFVCVSMPWCGTVVAPVLWQWSSCSLAPGHRCSLGCHSLALSMFEIKVVIFTFKTGPHYLHPVFLCCHDGCLVWDCFISIAGALVVQQSCPGWL